MRTKISLAIVILLIALGLIATVSKTNNQVEIHQLDLRTKQQQIDILNKQTEANELKLEEAQGDQKKLKQIEAENKKLQDEIKALQARKLEKQRLAQLEAQNVAQASPQTPRTQVSGTKADWLRASGIPESQWGLVDQIVQKESGWNPNAVNASSGACGLGQQLPCGKWAGAWNDPVSALQAMSGYVDSRYGGWQGAWNFWQANSWY